MTAAASGSSGMASSRLGFIATSALQRIQVVDVDAAALAEYHDQNGESDRGLGRGHRQHEEDEDLAANVAQVAREGHEVEVGGEQQQLDAHEQQDHVLAIEEDARDGDREQDRRQGEQLSERDHERFSASILTMRTRSAARTAT